MRPKRVRAYRSGRFAEAVAGLLLRLKGHRIVAQRYKTPVGEIDLVALKGKRLAFIEVKRRKTTEDAAWTLPARQRRRIVRAAQYWLARASRLLQPRHRLRRGAGGALEVASAHRERISCVTSRARRNSPLARLCL
jgi:putative endonuclease